MSYVLQKQEQEVPTKQKYSSIDNRALPTLINKEQLNTIITNKDGSPDYLAINIYYDTLKSWYNKKIGYKKNGNVYHISKLKTPGIFLNYTRLAEIHGCSKETIRQKIVKLEHLGLVHRSFQHKETSITKSYNGLIVYVWKDTPYFYNPMGIDSIQVPELTAQTNHEYIEKRYGVSFGSQAPQNKGINIGGGIQAWLDTKELNNQISKDIRSKARTCESKLLQISQEVISNKNNTTQITTLPKEPVKPTKFKKRLPNERKKPTRGELKAKVYKPFAYSKPKSLSDMLPLIDGSTCDELRSKSGRPFSDNFITQLVLKMSRDHRRRPVFNYRSGFIAYMVKALKHELHDAVKTCNIGFRFKANIPVNNNEHREQEILLEPLKPQPIELPKGAWGDICRRLIDIYDEHIYRNWLSKLIIFLDERDKFITLEAPSSFMKEWIEMNYWDSIKKIGESMGFELRGIRTQACLKRERVFAYGTTSKKVIDNLPGESTPNGFQKVSVFEIVDKLLKV